MSDRTGIEWTDSTWNPLRGCTRVSEGCKNCYAETVAARFCGAGQPYEGLIHPATKGWNGKITLVPKALGIPWRWTRPRRIFVNSMSDLFHPSVPFEYIAAVFFVMGHTTRHTYQVLTKRPERMLEFFRWVEDYEEGIFPGDRISDVAFKDPAIMALGWQPARAGRGGYDNCGPGWPYANVWIGVSVENQTTADERIPLLLKCPAAVRFLSIEPLLGPVDLNHVAPHHGYAMDVLTGCTTDFGVPFGDLPAKLDWIIVGGESGPGARPMHPAWVRSLREQCARAGVPFLFKQWGSFYLTEVKRSGEMSPPFPLGADLARGQLAEPGSDVFHPIPGSTPAGEVFRPGNVLAIPGDKKATGRKLDGVEHNAYPVTP